MRKMRKNRMGGYVSVIGESAHSQSNISSFDEDSTDSTSSDTI